MNTFIISIIFLVVLIFWLEKRKAREGFVEESMIKGLAGESMVKGILKKLPDDYYVMNDLILEKKIKGQRRLITL